MLIDMSRERWNDRLGGKKHGKWRCFLAMKHLGVEYV